jgi:hypothetical protein
MSPPLPIQSRFTCRAMLAASCGAVLASWIAVLVHMISDQAGSMGISAVTLIIAVMFTFHHFEVRRLVRINSDRVQRQLRKQIAQ